MSLPEIVILTELAVKDNRVRFYSIRSGEMDMEVHPFLLRPGTYVIGGYDPATDTVVIASDDKIFRSCSMVQGITALYIQFILSMPKACW